MSTLPSTPPSPYLPPVPPEPHEYTSIIHSIQRRSVDRASTFADDAWRRPPPGVHDLEADLRLSAQVGVALLQEKSDLETKLRGVEGANQKLLDRLTASVKESSQLQRRLEEAVGNLEQAEGNNRALLVALEEDRKKMSRLTTETARLQSASTQLKALTRAHDDTKQELAAEQRRASSAEARVKKQSERMGEMEDQLQRAIADLEEMRQDKVLRSRRSHDALAKVRQRFNAELAGGGGVALTSLSESPEAAELLKLVESLVSENELLRSESAELHELLDVSRDEQSGLQSEIANRSAFADGPDSLANSRRLSSTPTLLSEVLMSPSASNSFSDFDGAHNVLASPASTNPTSFARSWAPSSSLASSRARGLNRTLSSRSVSPSEEPIRHTHFHYHLPSEVLSSTTAASAIPKRRGASQGGLATAGGKVPFGRGHGRRAMSMDVNSSRRNKESSISAPVSPMIPDSPSTGAASIISIDDSEPIRPRRHHRPLSLSLGPSLFPLVPEDGQAPVASFHRSRPSIAASLGSAPSGLSLASPERRRSRRLSDEDVVYVTVDSSTQTSPSASAFSRPVRPVIDHGALSPSGISDLATPPPSMSDLSEGDKEKALLEFGLAPGTFDARTAVLGTLIEHAGKLLARIQASDIATQEKRLKKQNLPGDVRHLASANLKDLLHDIEGLRTHFRRVLEQERTTSAREATSAHSELVTESLVIRRDFVSLVKLFRDLLFETSRLRSLVNRVELDPSLAASLRELDVPNIVDPDRAPKATPTSGGAGLLAPFSRLFSGVVASEPLEPVIPKVLPSPRPAVRPIAKLSGSSAVTSATVNVEFGSGAVRRAVASGPGGDGSPDLRSSTTLQSPVQSQESIGRKKSESQARRDLSSIFAGGLPAPRTSTDPWVVIPQSTPARSSLMPLSNPFGRLLAAAYRPAMTSTTNAVLDSLPHAPPPNQEYQPTLLERQLRPRGLSDSSIRSTFVQHANPHHRLISPATLALSAEAPATPVVAMAIPTAEGDAQAQLTELSTSVSTTTSLARKASIARLKAKPGSMLSRSVSGSHAKSSIHEEPIPPVPPVPSLPISMSASPKSSYPDGASVAEPSHVGSLFGAVSHWASRAVAFSPGTSSLAFHDAESERGRSTPMAGASDRDSSIPREGRGEHWLGVGSLSERGGRHMG